MNLEKATARASLTSQSWDESIADLKLSDFESSLHVHNEVSLWVALEAFCSGYCHFRYHNHQMTRAKTIWSVIVKPLTAPPLLLKLFSALPTRAVHCAHINSNVPTVVRKRTLSPPASAYFSRLGTFPHLHFFCGHFVFVHSLAYHTFAHPGSLCSATSEHQACSPSRPASTSLELARVQSGLPRWTGPRGT